MSLLLLHCQEVQILHWWQSFTDFWWTVAAVRVAAWRSLNIKVGQKISGGVTAEFSHGQRQSIKSHHCLKEPCDSACSTAMIACLSGRCTQSAVGGWCIKEHSSSLNLKIQSAHHWFSLISSTKTASWSKTGKKSQVLTYLLIPVVSLKHSGKSSVVKCKT